MCHRSRWSDTLMVQSRTRQTLGIRFCVERPRQIQAVEVLRSGGNVQILHVDLH